MSVARCHQDRTLWPLCVDISREIFAGATPSPVPAKSPRYLIKSATAALERLYSIARLCETDLGMH